MLKKTLPWGEDRNQIEPRTGFCQFNVKTKKVCICFASFSTEQEHFSHDMYITAVIRPSDVKNRTGYVLWRNDAKVFRRNSTLAITLVVTSRSSSFEYTMSVHTCSACSRGEKCVLYCSIYWNTPNHHQSISNAAPRVQTYPRPTQSSHLQDTHSI